MPLLLGVLLSNESIHRTVAYALFEIMTLMMEDV